MAETPSPTAASEPLAQWADLYLIRGQVSRVAERPGHGVGVQPEPEIWLTCTDGRERHAIDPIFAGTSVGDELVLAFDKRSKRVLGSRNLTQGKTAASPRLRPPATAKGPMAVSVMVFGFVGLLLFWLVLERMVAGASASPGSGAVLGDGMRAFVSRFGSWAALLGGGFYGYRRRLEKAARADEVLEKLGQA